MTREILPVFFKIVDSRWSGPWYDGPLNMLIIVKPKEHLKSGSIKIPPTLKKILQEEESLTVEQMLF